VVLKLHNKALTAIHFVITHFFIKKNQYKLGYCSLLITSPLLILNMNSFTRLAGKVWWKWTLDRRAECIVEFCFFLYSACGVGRGQLAGNRMHLELGICSRNFLWPLSITIALHTLGVRLHESLLLVAFGMHTSSCLMFSRVARSIMCTASFRNNPHSHASLVRAGT